MTDIELNMIWETITHEKWKARWVEKFHNLTQEKRLSIIQHYKNKYESDDYIRSEYKKGWEPRTPMYDIFWEYAEKYGKIFETTTEDYFPTSYLILDDTYILRMMFGQGTVIDIFTLTEYKDNGLTELYEEVCRDV